MSQEQTTLFEILRTRGISRRWFAMQTGLNETTLSKIAKGERQFPAWFKPIAARILQLPESVVFFEVDVPSGTATAPGSTAP